MENNYEKTFANKDLYGLSESEFDSQITNDFVGSDFIEQLEWGMMMIKNDFKQVKLADFIPEVGRNHFDKSYLISASLNDNIKYLQPLTEFQVTPDIFPLINIKMLNIHNTIQLNKIKEMDALSKRKLQVKRRYAYELSHAFYKKDTERFYGIKQGFEINPNFFNILSTGDKIDFNDLPRPISLSPKYNIDVNWYYSNVDAQEIADIIKLISMAYQVAMSMYYEWTIYLREPDNIGIIIPIEPSLLSEIYKTSMMKFESSKRMIHFVKEHYRRKRAVESEDYSIYINKYLRGEHKFDYRGFYAEIIPPKYDLNRSKTKKKFIDPNT